MGKVGRKDAAGIGCSADRDTAHLRQVHAAVVFEWIRTFLRDMRGQQWCWPVQKSSRYGDFAGKMGLSCVQTSFAVCVLGVGAWAGLTRKANYD